MHPASQEAFLKRLRGMAPDLCVTAAYGNILPKAFLAIPAHGTLNIHPSLLPRWRGAAPVPRALEARAVCFLTCLSLCVRIPESMSCAGLPSLPVPAVHQPGGGQQDAAHRRLQLGSISASGLA